LSRQTHPLIQLNDAYGIRGFQGEVLRGYVDDSICENLALGFQPQGLKLLSSALRAHQARGEGNVSTPGALSGFQSIALRNLPGVSRGKHGIGLPVCRLLLLPLPVLVIYWRRFGPAKIRDKTATTIT